VGLVKCPGCAGFDDKVIDSRTADDGSAIRRRRECLACGRRFTTYERLEEAPLVVVKRSDVRVPFDRSKIVAGIRAAAKNRPVPLDAIEALGTEIEEALRLEGPEVTTEQIGRAVLDRLRDVDEVAYLRFVSVYKGFEDLTDFEREVVLLTAVSRRPPGAPPPEASG
jgi:transcriptional repressor NrdR